MTACTARRGRIRGGVNTMWTSSTTGPGAHKAHRVEQLAVSAPQRARRPHSPGAAWGDRPTVTCEARAGIVVRSESVESPAIRAAQRSRPACPASSAPTRASAGAAFRDNRPEAITIDTLEPGSVLGGARRCPRPDATAAPRRRSECSGASVQPAAAPPAVAARPVPPLSTATISSSPDAERVRDCRRPCALPAAGRTLPSSSCRPSGQRPRPRSSKSGAVLKVILSATQDCSMGQIGATALGELSDEIVDVVMAEIGVARSAGGLVGRSDHAIVDQWRERFGRCEQRSFPMTAYKSARAAGLLTSLASASP